MNSSVNNDPSPKGSKDNNAEDHLNKGAFGSYEAILNLRVTMFTDKINIVKSGIRKTDLADIREQLGLDYSVLSTILGVHERNLYIKKGNESFNRAISDKIMCIAELYSYGYDIFKSAGHFQRWMTRENRSLGVAPVELLDTYVGIEEVRNEIRRMEYGIF